MGCFLGCFGLSTKRKRRKPANRILPGDSLQKLISYEPLDSFVSVNLDNPEDPITSNSQLSKPKEKSSIKIRKKVTFNLNVQTYEPIPDEETTTYQFLQSVEEKESEKNDAVAGGGLPSNSLQMGSYPTNYRYQNCRESYDEEDEMAYEESDLEDDDYFDDDDYDYDRDYRDEVDKDVEDQRQRQEEFLDQFDSLNMETPAKNKMPLGAPTDEELKLPASGNPRIRSQYLCSVLNPVENTTQWKEIKARAAPPPKYRRKENIALEEEPQISFSSKLSSNCSPRYNQSRPLLQGIAVDASLSNWLTSPNTDEPKIVGSTKGCNVAFDTLTSKKNTCDGSFAWSGEDRVVLDI